MEPQSKYIEANGINHHYLEWGEPGSPPLLMVHGTGHCAQVWNSVARALSGEFRIICLDQRGHGDTDAPGEGYTFQQVGQDLAAIIEAMSLTSVLVLAHSSGGFAAIIADSLNPGIIGQALLVETVIIRQENAPGLGLEEMIQRTRQKRSIWESREAIYQAYRSRSSFKSWREDVFRDFIEGGTRLLQDGRAQLKCSPDVEASYYECRESLDLMRYFPGLKGEYMLLLGDYVGPQAQTLESEGVRRFLETVPASRVEPAGKGTHHLPMEFPDLVLAEARAFFAQ